MRLLHTSLWVILFCFSARAQQFDYILTTSTDTYTNLVNATSVNNGQIWDEPQYFIFPGFPFEMLGHDILFFQFGGSGAAMVSPTADPQINTILFPFEMDLIDRGTGGSASQSPISMVTTGSAGNRITKIEFKNAGSYNEMADAGTLNMYINFQYWLYEGSNTIQFRFGPSMISDPDLFYGGDNGGVLGMTDFDDNNNDLYNAHFFQGLPTNPQLAPEIHQLLGTPAAGTVYTLTYNFPFTVNIFGVNNTSVCNPNGSATVNVTGGTGPYLYIWNTGATTSSITGLDEGLYSVTVSDAVGATMQKSVNLSGPDELLPNVTGTDETAFGANDGTAESQPTGGLIPYTYLWNTGATTAGILNLAPGIYTVTITDFADCIVTGSVTVNEFGCPTLSISDTIQHVSCYGDCNGSISVEVNGGVAPYTYLWNNLSTIPILSNVCAGNYDVTITDSNGCFVTSSYTITQPDTLIVGAGSTNESLQGANDGTAWVIPTGGTLPYSYLWSNGSTDSLLINLSPGSYNVTVSDAHNCTGSAQVNIEAGDCGSLLPILTQVTCFAACNGSIEISFQNGVLPISYEWNTGDTTASILNLCAGSYSVIAEDSVGCVLVDTFEITEPVELQSQIFASDETASGLNNGAAWAIPTGGMLPYAYQWNTGSTDSLITNLAPGLYTVTISDAQSCSVVKEIEVHAFVCFSQIEWGVVTPTCHDSCDATVTVLPIGGAGPITFLWNTGDTSQSITNLCAGEFRVTIIDQGRNCVDSSSILIDQPLPIIITLDSVSHQMDSTISQIAISVTGGTAPYVYLWNGPDGYQNQSEDLHDILPGYYSLIVADTNGCMTSLDSIEILDLSTGISNVLKNMIKIYPNPVHDQLLIHVVENIDFEMKIIRPDGMIVYTGNNTISVDVKDLSPGIYFVRFSSGDEYFIKTVSIIK